MALGRKLVLTLIGCLLGAVQLSAQSTGTVTGRVVEGSSQEPLAGAGVTVAERNTLTGPDGRFTVTGVPAGTHTVRVTRIGYGQSTQSVTVAAGQTATANFSLASAALVLESVVAIGYGTQEARDNTGAVEAVTADEFNTGTIISPEQLIQGKVAGVQVVDNNEPGGGMNIRIRGGTSINASNEPLFVVDGTPLSIGGGISAGRNPLNFLNPDDIESVTVLKDASATAIYGSRGANGVVIITTKKGNTGGPQFSYSGSVSSSQVTRSPELLDADQFRAAVTQYAPSRVGLLGNASTDWVGEVERDAMGQEHTVAMSGAGSDMNYRLSLGYLEQDGVLQGSTLERVSAALNYSHLILDRLNVQASFLGARTDDQFTPGGILGSATAFAPTQPIRLDDGTYYEWANTLSPNNPLAELALVSDRGTTYRGVGNLEARYQLPWVQGLSGTGRFGVDVTEAERTEFRPTTVHTEVESGVNRGFFWQRNPQQTNTVMDLFGNYTRDLGRWDSNLDATAGYSYEYSDAEFPEFQADSLASDLLGPDGIPAGSGKIRPLLSVEESKLASFFGRANFSVMDRYLLTLSVRRDGSSRFGPNNQWGTFPSAAFAWRIADESFMDGVTWIDDLKLRASWGVNGNQAFGNYRYLSTYLFGDAQARVQFGNEFVNTIRPGAADPNLKWEETTSYNLGLDFAVLGGRVEGSVEYYVKDTDDLIFDVPVAAGTNLSNFVTTNIGSMRNRGFELGLGTTVLDDVGPHGLRWTMDFNAAHNTNELLRINAIGGGSEQIQVGGIAGGVGSTIQVLQPGYAVNSFFVYRHRRGADGRPVYEDRADDNDNVINENDLYEDLNGDGSVTQSDRAPFESPSPDWILGHTSNLEAGLFDLSFTLRAYLGNYVYNNVASNLGNYSALTNSGGPTNLHVSVLENQFVNPQYFSDVYVEDASFLRMDNLTLGVRVPGPQQVRDLRVYGTIQNVFTLTGYSGVDPTAGLNGIDNNLYPRSRTFSLGLGFGF
jgi:TonB-dependent starch-binding outer membrane protein SusC